MRKLSNLHLYEVLAIVNLAIFWGLILRETYTDYEPQLTAMNLEMEQAASLEKAAIQTIDSSFQAKVYSLGNTPEDIKKLERVAILRQKTNATIHQLAQLKQALKHNPNVARLANVKRLTHTHVQWLRKAFQDLDFNNTGFQRRNQSITNYAHFNRLNKTAVIALLSQKQLELRYLEKLVAQRLMYDDSFSDWKFYRVGGQVVAPIRTIQVGDVYTADLFVGSDATHTRTRMYSYGQPVAVQDDAGKVEIPTSKSGKFYWSGTITYRDIYQQKECTVQLRQAYEVLPQDKQ